ncbi:unnamed protein product, partial [Meganyctiphanes norvegica]
EPEDGGVLDLSRKMPDLVCRSPPHIPSPSTIGTIPKNSDMATSISQHNLYMPIHSEGVQLPISPNHHYIGLPTNYPMYSDNPLSLPPPPHYNLSPGNSLSAEYNPLNSSRGMGHYYDSSQLYNDIRYGYPGPGDSVRLLPGYGPSPGGPPHGHLHLL